jgi:hypothetical protein
MAGEDVQPGVWDDLTPDNRRRVSVILSAHVPEVFRLNRVIEQKTGYDSSIARNMLVDALSHLGTLAQRGSSLSPEQQASQLAKIEEHLRRAIIEHPEEVVRNRIADLPKLWSVYQREAYGYRERGDLHGVPRHQELEELRQRVRTILESCRSKKPDETTWEESLDIAAEMTQAADLAAELSDKLDQCIGAAQRLTRERERDATTVGQHRRTNRQWAIGILVGVLLAAGSVYGGYWLGKKDATKHQEPKKAVPIQPDKAPKPPTKTHP